MVWIWLKSVLQKFLSPEAILTGRGPFKRCLRNQRRDMKEGEKGSRETEVKKGGRKGRDGRGRGRNRV